MNPIWTILKDVLSMFAPGLQEKIEVGAKIIPFPTKYKPEDDAEQPEEQTSEPAGSTVEPEKGTNLSEKLIVPIVLRRTINDEGCTLIKKFEGLCTKAYKDVIGVVTIGYGSTGEHVQMGMEISEQEAEDLLKLDLERFEKGVEKLVTVALTDNQFAALVSFSFNCGLGNLKSSTLLRKLNAGDYSGAAMEFQKWNKAGGKVYPGLTKRRAAESELFGN